MRLTTSAVDLRARDALVMQHVPLVRSLAQRLAQRLPAQVELNDLISVGVLGLVEAANRYRPTLGVPFDAFARRRVNGAMLDSLRDLDWAPRSLRRLRRELDAVLARLRHELRREPMEKEIAAAMNLSLPDYERAIESLRVLEVATIRQLDAPGPDGESLLEVAIDRDEGFVAKLERKELRQHLATAITTLPEREQQILVLSYEEELTLAEIGEVLGVSESRVCQLRSLAIARLRTALSASLGIEVGRYAKNGAGVVSAYQGSTVEVSVDVSQEHEVTIVFNGESVARGSDANDVFTVFDQAIAAVRAGDEAGMSAALDGLGRAIDRVTALQSRVGASLRSIEEDVLQLQESERASTARVSSLEDANMAAAISGMTQAETTYRAALGAAVQLNRRSLMDYLK